MQLTIELYMNQGTPIKLLLEQVNENEHKNILKITFRTRK